jgi:RNA polymerase sigma-70 factor (ECF subfamily)
MLPEQLLQEIASGNQSSLKKLYALFKDKVYNTTLAYLQHTEEAEEATQDVFIEIYESASTFKATSSVSTWIYRITVNKCLDRLRHQKRQKRFAFITSIFKQDSNELAHDTPAFEHPGVQLENKEMASTLFAAIRQLPENQQTVFILKQVEGLPQKEIAGITGLTEKAVEGLMQRAKANLRKLLEKFYDEAKGNF